MTTARTRIGLALTLCAALAMPTAASAAKHHHKAKAPKPRAAAMDTIHGDGAFDELSLAKAQLIIDAKSDPDGSHPTGQVTAAGIIGAVPFRFRGAVTCMRIRGNEAVVKYDFAEASPSVFKGGGIEVYIKDAGLGLQDYVGFVAPMDALTWKLAGPSRCDPIFFAPFGVVTGDYVINNS